MSVTDGDPTSDGIEDPSTSTIRGGISDKCLELNGVHKALANEGFVNVGDLVIPYYHYDGSPIKYTDESGRQEDFKRTRIAAPTQTQKYSQPRASGSRAYIPRQLKSMEQSNLLFIVEGEFKAMSLIDEGLPAMGLPNFNVYSKKDEETKILLGGIYDVVNKRNPNLVYFIGDSDTVTNAEFARNALFLAKELQDFGVKVLLPRIGIGGPGKGIDDCREVLGDEFEEWFEKLLKGAECIDLKSTYWALVVQLLQEEAGVIKMLKGAEQTKHHRRVGSMIQKCDDPVQKAKLVVIGAKVLGVSKADLKMIARKAEEKKEVDSLARLFHEPEQWPEFVSTEELLDELVALINKHCYLPEHAAVAVALWILMTYVLNDLSIAPRLYVYSPTKQCGKTTLLEVVKDLSRRGLMCSNLSPAVLMRVSDALGQPTMVIDEVDTFLDGDGPMTGIINSSHHKSGAVALRCVGDNHDLGMFSTWVPIAMGGIGRVRDTIEDRSVLVSLERKPSSVSLDRLRRDEIRTSEIPMKLARWAADNEGKFTTISNFEELPNDRANDNWEPLIAIAESAGPKWHSRSIQSAHALTKNYDNASMRDGERIVHDIKALFEEHKWLKVSSEELADKLGKIEGSPWAEFGASNYPITKHKLAALLRPYGVKTKALTFSDGKKKGYEREAFEEIFEKYAPDCNSERSPVSKVNETPAASCQSDGTTMERPGNQDVPSFETGTTENVPQHQFVPSGIVETPFNQPLCEGEGTGERSDPAATGNVFPTVASEQGAGVVADESVGAAVKSDPDGSLQPSISPPGHEAEKELLPVAGKL
ncbi:DUF3631 domain-containing protein [bacterium]|nr:DUF3631 domain-containing protein [bacterium]